MTDRPHIIVFQTDDHGRWANGCYGNPVVQTPSIDHIAATGACMEQAFTPNPVCSPGRACFWTGTIPSAHGIHDYLEEQGAGADHPGLRGQRLLADRLKALGYRTALMGKWHCNHPTERPPGFDEWFCLSHGTSADFKDQHFHDGECEQVFHGHQAPLITQRALDYLDRAAQGDQPIFCYIGYTDTHTPHRGSPERLVDRYRGHDFAEIPTETVAETHGYPRITMPDDAAQRREWLAQYYAAASMIDEQVGAVLDRLDNLGLSENTLVVYTGDHGHMNGHHGLHTKGNATIPQNLIDESLLVPAVLRWPGRIAPGQRHAPQVDHCDLFATLLDAAGAGLAEALADAHSPGHSYLPLLTGQTYEPKRIQFCEYGNARVARTPEAKLIIRSPGPNGEHANQFFDLVADPRERVNAIDDPDHAATIAELEAALEAHFIRYQHPQRRGDRIAQQPTHNTWQPWSVTPDEARARG